MSDQERMKKTIMLANLVLDGLSIREIAKKTNMSRSTIHNYLSKYLDHHSELYKMVRIQLIKNYDGKGEKGANATKKLWEDIRNGRKN